MKAKIKPSKFFGRIWGFANSPLHVKSCGLTSLFYINYPTTLGQRGCNACGDEGLLSSLKQEPPGNGDRVPVPA